MRCSRDCGVIAPGRPDACSSPSARAAAAFARRRAVPGRRAVTSASAPTCARPALAGDVSCRCRSPSAGALPRICALEAASGQRRAGDRAAACRRRRRRRPSAWLHAADAATTGPRPYPSPGAAALAPAPFAPRAERLGPRRTPAAARRGAALAALRARAHRAAARRCRADALRDRWWQRWREARSAAAPADPRRPVEATLARYPFLRRAPRRRRRHCAGWPACSSPQKEFVARAGLVRHRRDGGGDRGAGLPAGSASGPRALRRLRRHRRPPRRRSWRGARSTDDDGIVHEYDEVLTRRGDGGRPGDAVVARRARRGRIGGPAATTSSSTSSRTCWTCADGVADGVPRCRPTCRAAAGERSLDDEYRRFADARRRRRRAPSLDPYGAEAVDEFFAVAARRSSSRPADCGRAPALYACSPLLPPGPGARCLTARTDRARTAPSAQLPGAQPFATAGGRVARRFGLSLLRGGLDVEHRLALVVDVDRQPAAVDQAAEQQLVGQRAADRVLDQALHRPRAHQRIEALLRQVLAQRVA